MPGPAPLTAEIPEWSGPTTFEGVGLDAADRPLCERLRGSSRLEIDETPTGLRIRSRSWIGVVQLSQLRLHVVPKLLGRHLDLVRMLDWSAGLAAMMDLPSEHDLELTGSSLLDLVALLFVRATEGVVRTGLRTAYLEQEETTRVLRGRLLVNRQVRRRYGRLEMLECRYDERTCDIFDNQLLLAATERCAMRANAPEIRRRALRLRTILQESCDARGVGMPRRDIHYDRLNGHYRVAHELSWLILEGSHGLEDLFANGSTSSFAFLLDMNILFERFVERLLATALEGLNVHLAFQKPSGSVVQHASSNAPYLNLIPDTVAHLNDGEVRVPIDAKYKRYSQKKVDSGDVAQGFIYAQGLGCAAGDDLPRAMIVYPTETHQVDRLALVIRGPNRSPQATLTVLGIPVAGLLAEVMGLVDTQELLPQVAHAVTASTR